MLQPLQSQPTAKQLSQESVSYLNFWWQLHGKQSSALQANIAGLSGMRDLSEIYLVL